MKFMMIINYHDVKFVNISLSTMGIFGNSCEPFIHMCRELGFEKQHLNFIVRKLITITI